MKRTCFLFVVVLAVMIGCIPTQAVKPTIQDTAIIEAPFDKTWAAVVATLAELALPVESIEKESGLLTTKFVTFANFGGELDKIAQRPSVFLGVWSRGRYTLSIFVSPSEASTKIKITAHIEGYESNLTESWHSCYSKGVIEEQFFGAVRAKI